MGDATSPSDLEQLSGTSPFAIPRLCRFGTWPQAHVRWVVSLASAVLTMAEHWLATA